MSPQITHKAPSLYKPAVAVCIGTLLLVLYGGFATDCRSAAQKHLHMADTGGSRWRSYSAERQPSCAVKINYISSAFEQSWLDNVASWQNSFCEAVKAPQQQAWTKAWLDSVKEENAGRNVTYNPEVFSRFVTTTTCPGKPASEMTTWIEPLAHGLRHPNALCDMGADLFDRGYLLLTNQADVQALRSAAYPPGTLACQNRTCQSIYMDLGATRWEAAPNSVGQRWFVRSYQARGIDMDRLLLWEARPVTPPSSIFAEVPKELFHKYQYFNIPAITDYNDASHPVRMLKAIAQPSDFVAFKLDIDNYIAEYAILEALMKDPSAHALVDEFYFEFHVNFQPMVERGWLDTDDRNKTLADAFKLFHELRQKGWRAHSWV